MFVEDQLKKNVSENTPITNNIQWWGCPIIEPPDTEMLLAVSQHPDYKIWQTSNFSLELALVIKLQFLFLEKQTEKILHFDCSSNTDCHLTLTDQFKS
jgi:hypothetical protein